MNEKLAKQVSEKAKQDLINKGQIDYQALIEEFQLSPRLAADGIHIRIMLDESVILINPEQDYIWEKVDEVIYEFKNKNK